MKESEAREKRCCGPMPCGEIPEHVADEYMKAADQTDAIGMVSLNAAAIAAKRYCIGSECMAWVESNDKIGDDGRCGLVRDA